MKPHKHAELIKAWADGAEIECLEDCNSWIPVTKPIWREDWVYRIKPEPKEDKRTFLFSYGDGWSEMDISCYVRESKKAIMLIYDGETGELKSAEVLK